MSVLLALVFAAGIGSSPQDSAARQTAPDAGSTPPPASTEIGDEPGVLSGHGPVRHTPVPGVKFRTAAPATSGDAPAERRLGGDPPIPIPTPGPVISTGGGPSGSGGPFSTSHGDEPGTAPGGVRPPRPPR